MPTPPTPDPDPLSSSLLLTQTLASLIPTLQILNRFHHRNRNQHRIAKWYSHLDMLRRHLRKFLVAVEGRIAEVERMSVKKKKKGDNGGEEVRVRAGWIGGVLVRGAYLPFTQLTADNQFAHMGLMLLGVLAQVDKAVSVFAPVAESEKETAGEEAEAGVTEEISIPDVGIPVSREDVAMSLPVERQEDASFAQRPREKPRETVEMSSAKDMDRPKIKTKKKASGGDEFDDIFWALEKPSKRPKKRKKGDKFDDIFSGL
ncbi:hypothetical protein QBC34DRAFT_432258 [Podospora aff. communis PSN243]|uniref:RNase MRP protein 1 RNA binding domain-containing protein n=1 Tax=Podospora aff. communis PSN243 TaxID=3040156 RepID=A0AAV9HA53_9PEZI|nr:hypothetical protein QBC34DRAFT_432258 [Podospora aff. communis PSN243]